MVSAIALGRAGLLVALGATACHDVSRVETAAPARPGPTSTIVPLPVQEAQQRAFSALEESEAFERTFGHQPWIPRDDPGYADTFSVEDASDPVFGREVLSKPENRNDLYVHTFHSPLWPSPVYRNAKGALPFIAAFHVHLGVTDASHTEVSVRALDAEVLNGQVWGVGSCGPGYHWNYESVRPTGVEESRLLAYVASALLQPSKVD